jgi:hypothetical protein
VNGINNIFDADLRFDEIAICAKLFAAHTLVLTGEGGHHDDLYFASFWRRAQNI